MPPLHTQHAAARHLRQHNAWRTDWRTHHPDHPLGHDPHLQPGDLRRITIPLTERPTDDHLHDTGTVVLRRPTTLHDRDAWQVHLTYTYADPFTLTCNTDDDIARWVDRYPSDAAAFPAFASPLDRHYKPGVVSWQATIVTVWRMIVWTDHLSPDRHGHISQHAPHTPIADHPQDPAYLPFRHALLQRATRLQNPTLACSLDLCDCPHP